MCFVHAFLPSDFFVYLVEFLLASSGYGRYQSQIEVSYTFCPGGLRAFGVSAAEVTTVAAVSASTEAAGITSLPSGCRRISLAIRVYTLSLIHI